MKETEAKNTIWGDCSPATDNRKAPTHPKPISGNNSLESNTGSKPSFCPSNHFFDEASCKLLIVEPSSNLSSSGSPNAQLISTCGRLNTSDGSTVACPCCRRYLSSHERAKCEFNSDCKTTASFQENCHEDGDSNLFGVLKSGINYEVKEVLANGWVHKKGSGMDWFGSRTWKARWASLVLATVAGYDAEVPLFLVFWHAHATAPSTVIVLDATVVMAVDRRTGDDDNSVAENTYCFDIVHTLRESVSDIGSSKEGSKVTRTFSAPKKERNDWVFAISQCLLNYEKRRKIAKTLRARSPLQTGCVRPKFNDLSLTNGGGGLPPTSPVRRSCESSGTLSPGRLQTITKSPVSPGRKLPRPGQEIRLFAPEFK